MRQEHRARDHQPRQHHAREDPVRHLLQRGDERPDLGHVHACLEVVRGQPLRDHVQPVRQRRDEVAPLRGQLEEAARVQLAPRALGGDLGAEVADRLDRAVRRGERARHAVQVEHRLREQGELGRQAQPTLEGGVDHLVQHLPHLHVAHREVVVARHERRHVVHERVALEAGEHLPHLDQRLCQPVAVVVGEVQEETHDPLAHREREPRRHAEVDERDADLRLAVAGRALVHRREEDEDVPRVRVGVEVPVDRDLLEVGARELVHHRLEVVLQPRERRDGLHPHAADPLRGEDALGAVGPDHAGHDDALVLCQVAPEERGVPRLGAVVQLVGQRALELLHHAHHVHPLAGGGVPGEEGGQLAEELEVLHQLLTHARALHLHHHRPPVAQLGGVHLPQARAPQRLGVEGGEQLPQPPTQLLLDQLLHLGQGDRLHVVLQPRELAHILGRQHVGARGEHLAELHVRRPELHQPLTERHRLPGARRALLLLGGVVVGHEPAQAALPDDVAQSVPGQEPDDGGEAGNVSWREEHGWRSGQ